MTKSEFVDQVASESGLSKGEATKAVEASLKVIEDTLKRGGEINITGFGKFSVADRGARQGVNPQTGERIQIAASRVPKFSAGSASEEEHQGNRLTHFADRVAALVEERRSQIVLGLDPDPSRLWPVAVGAESVSEAITAHCRAVIEATASTCVAVKLQLACFERLGADGWRALEDTVAAAREHGLLVLADGKRGDVPVTARAYAQALVGETPTPFGPVAGPRRRRVHREPAARPRLARAARRGRGRSGAGCFVLVRTSNPGAADVQDLATDDGPGPRVARAHRGRAWRRRGSGDCGLSSVGAVTGATRPELLERLRELMPSAIFLLPGVGAQGGTVEDLAPAFRPHPAGGLVTASRSIVDAAGDGEDHAHAAATAAERAARSAAWALAC